MRRLNPLVRPLSMAALALLALGCRADTFALPAPGDSLVGELQTIRTVRSDMFPALGVRYNQGFGELKWANPDVPPFTPGEGAQVVIPSQYVLPRAAREGIVVNAPEMRLYYYPKPKRGEPAFVITHPISIGREDWRTPHGVTSVVSKKTDPTWYPPASIRKEHAASGDPLPKAVPPGPDNPLGKYAMKLGLPGYLIHGTNKDYDIGMRVTHGCMRLYNHDIERLFPQVPVGTPVRIVNQPVKLGVHGEELYIEVHPPLDEDQVGAQNEYQRVVDAIVAVVGKRATSVNWNALQAAISERRGIPVAIGRVAPVALPAPGPVQAGERPAGRSRRG
ncbi:MAG: L,D-transpeptidase family protein [Gammaproteobacteria bacterium]